MKIPIFVEPSPAGFRAMTGAPLDISAEGPSPAEAISSLEAQIARRIERGGFFVERPFPVRNSTPSEISLADNPLFDDFLAAVKEYQDEKEQEDREYYRIEGR